MAKIRLNNDKRDILRRLAAEVIQATPIEPETEARVAAARKDFDDTFAELAKQAKAAFKKAVPAGDIRVSKKYGHTGKEEDLMFIHLDTRDTFDVKLFNDAAFTRKHLKAGDDRWNMTYEERQEYNNKYHKACEKAMIEVINHGPGTYRKGIEASNEIVKLYSHLKQAKTELGIAEGLDEERRRTISRDFEALIAGSKTFEDVCEAWPEAKKVTGEIVGNSQQISLVSTEAIDRIRANMASRGVSEDS